jgi:hypothetical protein
MLAEARMLDGQRYFSEFPDEEPEQPKRLLLSDELLVTLAAIEREISEFIGNAAEGNIAGVAVSGGQAKD